MKKIIAALIWLLPILAQAQTVQQSGSITPNFAARWVTNGVIGSAGSATQGLLSSIGTANNGGPAICNRSATSAAYNLICLKSSATGGLLSLDNIGGATGGLALQLNGVTQGFAVVQLPVTVGDISCFANTSGNLSDCGFPPSGLPLVIGTTPITGGTNNYVLFNSSGILGNEQFVTLSQGGLNGSQAAATANQVPVFPGSGGAAVPTTITPAIISSLFANPTTAIGLTPINGSQPTAQRSDAAPALSSAIQTALTQTNNQVLLGTGAFGFSSLTPVNNASLQTNGSGVPSWQLGLPPGALANPNCTVGLTAVNGVATTAERTDSSCALSQSISPTMTGNWTFNPTSGTGLIINSVPTSNSQGVNIVMSGPNAGSVNGPINLNIISVNSYGGATNAGTEFGDFGAWTSTIAANRTNFTVGGSLGNSEPFIASFGHLRLTTATTISSDGDFIGAAGLSYVNVAAATSSLEGMVGAVVADSASANVKGMFGLFAEVDIINGATVASRDALRIANQGTATATGVDSAIDITSSNNNGSFKTGIQLTSFGPTLPLQTTANLFDATSGGNGMTLANIFNFPSMTVTGNILNFPNVQIGGSGVSLFGSSANSTGQIQIGPAPNSTGNGTLVSITNTQGITTPGAGTIFALLANEASRTTVRYGITLGNWAEIFAGNSNANGLIVGTNTNIPIVVGVNNIEQLRFLNGSVLAVEAAAPSTPAAGKVSWWVDSTDARFHDKNPAGTIGTTVVASTAPANQFANSLSVAGVVSYAQPSFTNLSGSVACSQLPALTGDITSSSCATTLASSISGAKTFTTSITSPIHAASGKLTFESNGSTVAGTISTGQLWMLGPDVVPNAGVILTVNANTVAPSNITAGISVNNQSEGPDGKNVVHLIDAFSTTQNSSFLTLRRARGTLAAYSAVQSADNLGFIVMTGATAANTFPVSNEVGAAGGVAFGGVATQNWSATAMGSKISIYTTANGAAALSLAATFDQDQSLTLQTQMFVPNITTSSAAQTGTVCWTTGTGKFTVDTTVGCLTSLAKAKNIDATISGAEALSIIERLKPVSFHYKKGWGDSGHYEQFGFTADQAATIDERLVGRDPNGELQGFRYQEYGAVLTAAMQALKADNDNLREEVTKLKRRFAR